MSTQDKGNKDCSNSNPDGDLNTAQPVSDDESSGDNTNGSVFNLCSHYRIPRDGFTLTGSSTYKGIFAKLAREYKSSVHRACYGPSKDMEKSVPSQRSDSLLGGSSEDDLPLHDAKNHHEDAKNESSLTDRVLLRQENENSVQENENKLMKATGNCEDNAFNSDQKKNPENVAEQLESGRMANTEVKTRIEIPARENERLPNRLEPVDLLPSSETFYISGGKAERRLEMRDTQRRGSKVFVIKDKESRVEDSLDRLPANEGSCDEPPRSKVFCAGHENTDVTASKSFFSSNLAEMTVTVATSEQDERINERDVCCRKNRASETANENEVICPDVNNRNARYRGLIPPKLKTGEEATIETEPKPPDSQALDTGHDQYDAEIPTNKDSTDGKRNIWNSMETLKGCNVDKTIIYDRLKIQEKGNEKKDMFPPPLNPNNGSVAQPNIAPAPGIRGYLERYETYFDIPIYRRCSSLHLEQLARIGFKFIKPDPGQAGRIICTDCGKLHSFTDIIRRSPKNFVWHENGCSFENKRFPCDHCENLNVHEQDWEWCNKCGQDILPVKAFSELEQHLQMIPEQQAQQNHAFISCLVCNQDVDSQQNLDTCTVCGGPLCDCYGYHNH
ncbi:uncharacterized protein LOC120334485 [Styela clava]